MVMNRLVMPNLPYDPQRDLDALARLGGRLVCPGDDEWPDARLTWTTTDRTFAPPLVLYVRGPHPLAGGDDEAPDVAWSLPLGAGRLSRDHFADGPPTDKALRKLRTRIRTEIAHDAGTLLRGGAPDHAVATSKTFRSLARICGAAPSGA